MRKPPNLTGGRSTFPVNFKATVHTLNLQTNLDDSASIFETELATKGEDVTVKVDLNDENSTVQTKINAGAQSLDVQADVSDESSFFLTDLKNIYYVSNAQSDWSQTDPTAPDYVKHKEIAEELRPIVVDNVEFLGKERNSGPVEFVSGENVTLRTDGNKIIIDSVGGSSLPDINEKEFLAWLLDNLPLGTGLKVFENEEVEEVEKELDINEEIEFIWDAN